jgi:serine/threonine-protein kinase
LGGLLVGAASWTLTSSATRPVARLEVTTAPTAPFVVAQLGSGGTQSLAVSPDGTRVVYRTRVEGRTHLYVRRIDQLVGTSLFADAYLDTPVISPDGAWVAFHAGDYTWKKVAMLGGPAVTLAPTFGVAHGAAWGPDDTIIVGGSVGGSPGLWRVPAAGGGFTVVTTKDTTRGEIGHWWPEVLPGGRAVLFTIVGGERFDTMEVAVLDLTTGEQRTLLPGGSRPRYALSGHLIYGVSGRLMAVPFDRDRLELAGTAVPLVEGVLTDPLVGLVEFDVSADGSLVYVAGADFGETQSLVWVDRQGREESINAPNRAYSSPRISPDGAKVALNLRDEENDIWIWDFARDTLTRLTFDPGLDRYPVWSPDGRRIAFSSSRDKSRGNLFWQTADGAGTVERLAASDDLQVFPTAFSPDGTRLLVFLASGSRDGADIAVVQPGAEARAVPLLATTFGERNGEVSPDGRWLAYNSNESGRDEVYVRPFPDVNTGRWQVSRGGGSQPLWARNGGELFFRTDAALMTVPIRIDKSFTAGNPAIVFEGSYAMPQGGRTYDVSPDGRRFLMIKEGAATDDDGSRAHIILVQNWTEELKRLVPVN